MWRTTVPTSYPTHSPVPSTKPNMTTPASPPPPCPPNSAQDLELVSALMSMRSSNQNYAYPHIRPLHAATPSTLGPDSPTRIDDEAGRLRSNSNRSQFLTPKSPMPSHHVIPPLYSRAISQRQLPPLGRRFESVCHPLIPQRHQSSASTTSVAGPANIRYTPEQRREAVKRFKAKKLRRKNQSTAIRYQIRKRLADTRPRFRGRFSKPKAAEEQRVAEDGK